MTLKEKYEQGQQDSENFISEEKVYVTRSYKHGKILATFFNKELDYTDINMHFGYPMEKFGKEDWNLKIRFELRKAEISRCSPLDAPHIFQYLSTLADSDWTKNEPIDSEAKEIMRGLKEGLDPVQDGLNIRSVGVEWAVHVPDCTTFYITFFYAYANEEDMD